MPTATHPPKLNKQVIEAAQEAYPPPPNAKGRWTRLLPALNILFKRGFTLTTALRWLTTRGELRPEEHRSAYYSLRAHFTRLGRPIPVRPKPAGSVLGKNTAPAAR